jgi:hypothetical protein
MNDTDDPRPCLSAWEVEGLRLWLRHEALLREHEKFLIWEVQHDARRRGPDGRPRVRS